MPNGCCHRTCTLWTGPLPITPYWIRQSHITLNKTNPLGAAERVLCYFFSIFLFCHKDDVQYFRLLLNTASEKFVKDRVHFSKVITQYNQEHLKNLGSSVLGETIFHTGVFISISSDLSLPTFPWPDSKKCQARLRHNQVHALARHHLPSHTLYILKTTIIRCITTSGKFILTAYRTKIFH